MALFYVDRRRWRSMFRFVPLAAAILLFLPTLSLGQNTSTILVLTNKKSKVLFDGEEKGICEANVPFKITTTEGEHYAQVQYDVEGKIVDKGEVVNLEPGKQKIIKLFFDETTVTASVPLADMTVAELNFSIPGVVNVGVWANANPGQAYPYPEHYFAFDKGDEIVLSTSMTNKNGTNQIIISTYPTNVAKYTNKSFTELNGLRIKVEERSVYKFTFATNHAFDRNCILKVSRRPGSPESAAFNTNVSKQRIYKPIPIVEQTSLRVNSGSNAALKGGKSRIIVPVTIPANTVGWFYRFSASRNQEDIDNVRKNFQLFGELSKLLLTASGAGAIATEAVSIGVDQLSMPPGSNHCDIFLLDYNNIGAFEAKTEYQYILEGTRQNLVSGNVKVECCNTGQFYLGIRNPDSYDGINVLIEVIAMTVTEDFVMEMK